MVPVEKQKNMLLFLLLGLLTVGLFTASVFTGSVHIPVSEIARILAGGEPLRPEWKTIVLDLRLPRALTALLAGMALSVSGLQMQTVFRNPLAGPFVLGITSGASLGVALVVLGYSWIFTAGHSLPGNWVLIAAAWLGSGAVLFVIMLVSVRVRDIMTILILGIMFGSAATALVSVMQYFSEEAMLKSYIIWTMGSLGNVSRTQMQLFLPAIAAGVTISLMSAKVLNALLLGESYARSLGVNISVTRFTVFISTSILAGTVTAFCGPIGFIGIAVPHIARMITKNANHRVLIPATILTGGVLMLISDIISRLPGHESNLPINSVTALIGIPVVIWIIIKNQKFSKMV